MEVGTTGAAVPLLRLVPFPEKEENPGLVDVAGTPGMGMPVFGWLVGMISPARPPPALTKPKRNIGD